MTTSKIYEAISSVIADIDAVGKEQENKDQHFRFRGIDDVYNEIHPIFAKHKVFTVPSVLSRSEKERQTKSGATWVHVILEISYKFFTLDGSFIEAIVIGEGRDSSDKASNKAMSIAHKYALIQVLCIPTKDEKDSDSQTIEGQVISKIEKTKQKGDVNKAKTFLLASKNLTDLGERATKLLQKSFNTDEQAELNKLIIEIEEKYENNN